MVDTKTSGEIERMRAAGKVVGQTLRLVADTAAPGMTLRELDNLAADHIRDAGAKPSSLGYHGDAALTVGIGDIDEAAERLIDTTQKALDAAIGAARAGNRIRDISSAVETLSRNAGYGLPSGLGGHGIGTEMHQDPFIPNTVGRGRGMRLEAGMTLALEPMLIESGRDGSRTMPDGWSIATYGGSRAAHFEHTILITTGEADILTLP